MQSTVRDFEMRGRSDTAATSNTFFDNNLRRTGTGGSRLSSISSHERGVGGGVHRSNTVKTYHVPEPSEPIWLPGAEPGVDTAASDDALPDTVTNLKAACEINIVDYSDTDVRNIQADNATLATALETPRPSDFPCRWISVYVCLYVCSGLEEQNTY